MLPLLNPWFDSQTGQRFSGAWNTPTRGSAAPIATIQEHKEHCFFKWHFDIHAIFIVTASFLILLAPVEPSSAVRMQVIGCFWKEEEYVPSLLGWTSSCKMIWVACLFSVEGLCSKPLLQISDQHLPWLRFVSRIPMRFFFSLMANLSWWCLPTCSGTTTTNMYKNHLFQWNHQS